MTKPKEIQKHVEDAKKKEIPPKKSKDFPKEYERMLKAIPSWHRIIIKGLIFKINELEDRIKKLESPTTNP